MKSNRLKHGDTEDCVIHRWIKRFRFKLLRAYGGCLGTERRRRTWQAAKSYGKVQATVIAVDIRMGQP